MPNGGCVSIDEIEFDGAVPIEGYGPGFFRVTGKVLQGAMRISAVGASGWQGYDDVSALLEKADGLDIVLVGTGNVMAYPPKAFRTTLQDAGIGVEFMATPAACRTYNMLLAEGRRVSAVLFAVEE